MTHRYLRPTWWVHRLVPLAERHVPPASLMPLVAWAGRVGGEGELRLLAKLVDPHRLAIDVGAADGVYAWHLARRARGCVAFEANPHTAARLRARLPNVEIHGVALSDRCGEVTLRVPKRAGVPYTGLATIEDANALDTFTEFEHVRVPMRTLDSFDLPPVGFLKIDVEGHELAVLEGARALLERDRPIVLVEVEERHRPSAVGSVRTLLAALGYLPPTSPASPQNLLFIPNSGTSC